MVYPFAGLTKDTHNSNRIIAFLLFPHEKLARGKKFGIPRQGEAGFHATHYTSHADDRTWGLGVSDPAWNLYNYNYRI